MVLRAWVLMTSDGALAFLGTVACTSGRAGASGLTAGTLSSNSDTRSFGSCDVGLASGCDASRSMRLFPVSGSNFIPSGVVNIPSTIWPLGFPLAANSSKVLMVSSASEIAAAVLSEMAPFSASSVLAWRRCLPSLIMATMPSRLPPIIPPSTEFRRRFSHSVASASVANASVRYGTAHSLSCMNFEMLAS